MPHRFISFDKTTFQENFYNYFNAAGTLLLIAGGCYFAGGLSGFVFGIPKLLETSNNVTDAEKIKRAIAQNDNLVQISDWVTKIIVGVGLTQLGNIPHFILKIGTVLAPSFGELTPEGIAKGRNVAIVTILYFTILGFITLYLWTRLYFTKKINQLEIDLNQDLKDEFAGLKKVNNEIQEKLTDAGGGKNTSSDEIMKMKEEGLSKTNVNAEEYTDDPQKGKWGKLPIANDRKMTATIVSSHIPNFYEVTLTVMSTNADKPLKGYVNFHLHNTFRNPNPIIAVEDNKAVLRLKMVYGAFTVGAEADNGQTKLELDLAELPDAPQDFKER